MLQYEMLGRANLGQGLLKTQTYELADLLVLNPAALGPMETEAIGQAFGDLSKRPPLMIYDEVRCGDRQALEDCLLDCLGFTELPERVQALHELHDAVCRMVWQRMSKTNNSRESRQTYDEWLASGEPFGEVGDEDDEPDSDDA